MVRQYPENELAWFSLGKALYDAGRHAEAREPLNKALARNPDWMVAQILVGRCELAGGDRVAARSAFERALRLAVEQNHEGPRTEMEQTLAELA